jgi:hypothetical protein
MRCGSGLFLAGARIRRLAVADRPRLGRGPGRGFGLGGGGPGLAGGPGLGRNLPLLGRPRPGRFAGLGSLLCAFLPGASLAAGAARARRGVLVVATGAGGGRLALGRCARGIWRRWCGLAGGCGLAGECGLAGRNRVADGAGLAGGFRLPSARCLPCAW